MQGLKWTIYNGHFANFWKDFWLPLGPIRNLVEGPLSLQEKAISIWDGDVKENGMATLLLQLLDIIIQAISATPFVNNPEL